MVRIKVWPRGHRTFVVEMTGDDLRDWTGREVAEELERRWNSWEKGGAVEQQNEIMLRLAAATGALVEEVKTYLESTKCKT